MQKTWFTSLLMLLFAWLAISCGRGNIKKDMVEFDRAYIPALAFTSQQKTLAAKKAIIQLNNQWKRFKKTYYSSPAGDTAWKKDFDSIDGYITQANKIISFGQQLIKPHETLENVRIIFMKLRERNHINYFIDFLTKFHEPMETIALTIKGSTAATLNGDDILRIKNALPQALLDYETIKNAKFDRELFSFSKEKAKKTYAVHS